MTAGLARALLLATCLAGGGAHAADYEVADLVRAAEILPERVRDSIHHHVLDDVRYDDGTWIFRLESSAGVEEVRSLALLRERLHEIHTMAQALAQLERSGEDDLARALAAKHGVGADSVMDILTDPVGTASTLAGNFGSNFEDTFSGDYLRRPQEAAAASAGPAREPDPFKRSVAAQLGLDVYSSNAQVQAFLDRLGAERAAGRLGASVATITAGETGGLIRARGVDEARYDALLKNNTATELRARNERTLAGLGVPDAVILHFLANPVLSPRHQTWITGYVEALAGVDGLAAIVEAAAGAGDEAEALGYVELAHLLAAAHVAGPGLARIDYDGSLPGALSRSGSYRFYVPVDRVIWNAATEAVAGALERRAAAAGATRRGLTITGTFSPAGRAALEARGILCREGIRL